MLANAAGAECAAPYDIGIDIVAARPVGLDVVGWLVVGADVVGAFVVPTLPHTKPGLNSAAVSHLTPC